MSFTKISIHAVWATKHRNPYLRREIRLMVFRHMQKNARENGIFIDHINGIEDHVHCLIGLHPTQSLSKVIQIIKGESSAWINRNGLVMERFCWQDQFYAISVSESALGRVRRYIKNQEIHHYGMSFVQEYEKCRRYHKIPDSCFVNTPGG